MSRPPIVFLLWAGFLALVAAVEWTLFTHHTPNYYLLVIQPAFAIVGTIAFALLSAPRPRPDESAGRLRLVPDLSLSSTLIGIAVVVMLWGSFIGEWLLLIGTGLLALGAGGLVRELRAGRRLRERAARRQSDQSEGL